MKLTLSVGGGVTGFSKENSVDINSLDSKTRTALIEYINSLEHKQPKNFSETWCLNDNKEVPIDKNKMSDRLKELYEKMKNNLSYSR